LSHPAASASLPAPFLAPAPLLLSMLSHLQTAWSCKHGRRKSQEIAGMWLWDRFVLGVLSSPVSLDIFQRL
jgi:hypothetical protein